MAYPGAAIRHLLLHPDMPSHGKPNATGRSSGQLSALQRKLHGPPKGEPWAWKTSGMLASPAHRSLSRYARLLLDFLEVEHSAHGGRENGNLKATYKQLAEFGIPRKQISRAISEAEAMGFIECDRGGRWNMTNRPNLFRLTWRADRENRPATNDWLKVSPADIKLWRNRQKPNQGYQTGTTVHTPLGTTGPPTQECTPTEMADNRQLPKALVHPPVGTPSIYGGGEGRARPQDDQIRSDRIGDKEGAV